MPYEAYETQKRQKREHRDAILILLKERRMNFTQLLKSTGFSPNGLTKMLNDLKKEANEVSKKIFQTSDPAEKSELQKKYSSLVKTLRIQQLIVN